MVVDGEQHPQLSGGDFDTSVDRAQRLQKRLGVAGKPAALLVEGAMVVGGEKHPKLSGGNFSTSVYVERAQRHQKRVGAAGKPAA